MDNIFTKLSLAGFSYAVFLCYVYIHIKIKNAIEKKRNYITEEKMTIEKLWDGMGSTKGKLLVAFFTASLCCFMFGNPFFRSITKTTSEKWCAFDLIVFSIGVIVFLFCIITIFFMNDNINKR